MIVFTFLAYISVRDVAGWLERNVCSNNYVAKKTLHRGDTLISISCVSWTFVKLNAEFDRIKPLNILVLHFRNTTKRW